MIRHAGSIFLILAVLLFQTACERREEHPPLPKVDQGSAKSETPAAGAAGNQMSEGEAIYRRSCAACHDKGVSGAPAIGDRETWKVRIATGIENMLRNAIKGYQGNRGVHPPRGGDPNLTDAQVEAAVRYMVEQSR